MDTQDSSASYAFVFTSFSIIMLAVFIFLNTLATPDLDKKKKALKSLEAQFPALSAGNSRVDVTKKSVEQTSPLPTFVKHFPKTSLAERYADIKSIADKQGLSITEADGGFSVTIPSEQLFLEKDQGIQARYLRPLEKIAKSIREEQLTVEIQTYVSSDPTSFDRSASDWELAIAQGQTLLRLMLDYGVPEQQLKARAFAQHLVSATKKGGSLSSSDERVLLILKETS